MFDFCFYQNKIILIYNKDQAVILVQKRIKT